MKNKLAENVELPIVTAELRRPEWARWGLSLTLIGVAALLVREAFEAGAPMIGLIALASGAAGYAVWRDPAGKVIFDGGRIHDDAGREICDLDDVEKVDRGIGALKPTSGFTLHLKTSQPFAWAPALWWRWGKRVGIGGATGARPGRDMATAINLALMKREIER